MKARTLWQAAHAGGLKTAAITWPVTADAAIDFDLPEFVLRSSCGETDLKGVSHKPTPGLVQSITAMFPSFPRAVANQSGIRGERTTLGVIVTIRDPAVAAFLADLRGKPEYGIGRQIPTAELTRFAPTLKVFVAAYEPATRFMFGPGTTEVFTTPPEKGGHGFWPLRSDYRSV